MISIFPIFLMFLIAATAGFVMVVNFALRGKQRDAWELFAIQRGFRFLDGTLSQSMRIEGRAEGFFVVIETYPLKGGRSNQIFTRAVVGGPTVPKRIHLSEESLRSTVGKAFGGQDIVIGDPRFDARIRVRGDEVACRAALNEEARNAAVFVADMADTFEVAEGSVSVSQRGVVNDSESLRRLQMAALRLAQSFGTGKHKPIDELILRIRDDSHADVRRMTLEALIQRFGDDVRTHRVCRSLLGSMDVRMAAIAALGLPTGGEPALARVVRSKNIETALRVRALRAWASRAPEHAAEWFTSTELAGAPPEIALAACTLGARILGRRSEPLLLQLLENQDESVQLAAARSLGSIGTVNAVEKLLRLSNRMIRGELGNVARSSIAQIQARAAGADAGQLSLSSGAEASGGLSAVEPAGGLSPSELPRPEPPSVHNPPRGVEERGKHSS